MPITTIGPRLVRRGESEETVVRRESFTQSTATAFQSLALHTDVVRLGVGTATGFDRNRYSLASGADELREKFIHVTGTGEAYLYVAGTSTGLFVLNEADDFVSLKYADGKWRVLSNTATVATST